MELFLSWCSFSLDLRLSDRFTDLSLVLSLAVPFNDCQLPFSFVDAGAQVLPLPEFSIVSNHSVVLVCLIVDGVFVVDDVSALEHHGMGAFRFVEPSELFEPALEELHHECFYFAAVLVAEVEVDHGLLYGEGETRPVDHWLHRIKIDRYLPNRTIYDW